jgi:5-hydroxyisourate hydrolase-like protein (transthyretin family)
MPVVVTVQLVNCMYGRPASGVRTWLYRTNVAEPACSEVTDDSGRCYLRLADVRPQLVYQLVLDIDSYFASLGIEPSYPKITLAFRADATANILLIFAPAGYMSYVGQ